MRHSTTLALFLTVFISIGACDDKGDDTADGSITPDGRGDVDDDGYAADDDCNDQDPAVNPGATEVCDGIDNNCDDQIDEGVKTTYYDDVDGDSYGDPDSPLEGCSQPLGSSSNPNDCDDNDADAFPGNEEVCDGIDNDCNDLVDDGLDSAWYPDDDGDGYGDTDAGYDTCSPPDGWVEVDGDCDDDDLDAFPGNDEVCDGIDNNCDGDVDEDSASDAGTWYLDADGDGDGVSTTATVSCSMPTGYAASDGDCDDGDNTVYTGATELCDGQINDCGSGSPAASEDDGDGDGYVECTIDPGGWDGASITGGDDCDDSDTDVNPAATEVCDGIDNDCDGDTDDDDSGVTGKSTWYADADLDGYGDLGATLDACDEPSGYTDDSTDCDDTDGAIYPGATETCDDVDEDCDGTADNGVLGMSSACPATDCAEVLDVNPTAVDGTYSLDDGSYSCDMTTEGGGWTLVQDDAYVYGTGYDTSFYNSEGFSWTEVLFEYDSGSVSAHCVYPDSLTGCNNLGFQFASEDWGVALNYGASVCGMALSDYTGATDYIGGYDFVISRSDSTDTIRLGSLEGISGCTTSDNSGAAYVDIWVRP